jgi:CBS-domain-containing membrane protein
MVDLVTVLVAAAISSGGNWTRAEEVLKERMADVLPVLRTYKQQDVGFLLDGIGTRQSLNSVVKRSFLCLHRHRIAINDCDAIVMDILSQSDILRFLQTNPNYNKADREKTLQEVGLGDARPIIKVASNEKVFTALKRMIDEKVRTLAVVDGDNRLTGAFYVNSLRGFGDGHLNLLEESVADFTRRLGHEDTLPLRATPETKVNDVITELVKNRAHHVFLMDGDGHPMRVISQADILGALFSGEEVRHQ